MSSQLPRALVNDIMRCLEKESTRSRALCNLESVIIELAPESKCVLTKAHIAWNMVPTRGGCDGRSAARTAARVRST